jgi:hypothetical protein
VLVIIAGAMIAILAMVALVLMGGATYWERRHLQELADSAALAASIKAGGDCSKAAQAYAVADMARYVLEAQLGTPTSGPSLSGICPGPGWVVTYGFADGTSAAINWPYANHTTDWVQATLRHTIPLQLPGFVGNSADIAATAIAQANGTQHPGSFALYAYKGITCQGGGTTIIKGSVYSGGPIDKNCSLWVQKVITGGAPEDFGDILVYPPNQPWSQGGGNCGAIISGKPSSAICADGYEESGNPATCAAPYPAGTSYLDPTQLAPGPGGAAPANPMPCPDVVPGPKWELPADPNYGPSAAKFGAPCPVGAGVTSATYTTATFPGAKGPAMRASAKVIAAAATSADAKGYWHFHPGCYAWIDVANVPGHTAVLDPGFYFFNGFFVSPGDPAGVNAGGLAINAGNDRLLGRDVTLEFANPAGGASSFSGTEINPASKTTSSCGGGQNCYLGADPNSPIDGFSYFSAPCDPALEVNCPLPGPSSWCQVVSYDKTGKPVYDESCNNVLVWAPPPGPSNTTEPAPIGGSFWFKGTGSYEWVYGAIWWPGECAWSANGDSILLGQLVCNTANIQGGSIASGPGVKFGSGGKNHFNNEPGLKA